MTSKSTELPRPFCGIIPPMVTPLLTQDTLDTVGLERLIEHILGGGVHGLFILGSTGEGPNLSYRLRHALIERTCEQVNGRVPVIVGITDTSFTESINTARKAKDAGASAAVLAPQYYFPTGQPELLDYIRHITTELPLPLILYNIPKYAKIIIEPETVRVAAEITGVAGLKDSSNDANYFCKIQSIFSKQPNFTLLTGSETFTAEAVLSGAHGGVCGGANIIPKLYADLYEAVVNKDLLKVQALQKKVEYICNNIYRVGKYESSYIKGIKCSLSIMGICSDFMAEPFQRFGAVERDIIRRHLIELGIALQN
jgi:dihydrodipicolinate synthase/N-acetylneuraminate lyase